MLLKQFGLASCSEYRAGTEGMLHKTNSIQLQSFIPFSGNQIWLRLLVVF